VSFADAAEARKARMSQAEIVHCFMGFPLSSVPGFTAKNLK